MNSKAPIFKILLLLICLLSLSCSNDNSDNISDKKGSNNQNNNIFTVTINDVDVTPVSYGNDEFTAFNEVQIVAYLTTELDKGDSIQITMDANIEPGTYSFDIVTNALEDYRIYGYYHENEKIAAAYQSGSLVITTHNKSTNRLVGTFNFVTNNSTTSGSPWVAKNGVFDVYYE